MIYVHQVPCVVIIMVLIMNISAMLSMHAFLYLKTTNKCIEVNLRHYWEPVNKEIERKMSTSFLDIGWCCISLYMLDGFKCEMWIFERRHRQCPSQELLATSGTSWQSCITSAIQMGRAPKTTQAGNKELSTNKRYFSHLLQSGHRAPRLNSKYSSLERSRSEDKESEVDSGINVLVQSVSCIYSLLLYSKTSLKDHLIAFCHFCPVECIFISNLNQNK